MGKFFYLSSSLFLFTCLNAMSQSRVDSSYVEREEEVVVLRFYFSQKFTDLKIPENELRYQPNSGLNSGFGISIKKFTLNLAGPLPFLNPSRENDFPRHLDLQGHFYPVRWMVDFFGQFYNGFKIPDWQETGQAYLRPDISLFKTGFHVSHVFFGERISIPAAMNQIEIQKKSAVSPLLGFEIYRSRVAGDSLIIPSVLLPDFNYLKADFLHFGPSFGFLGTLVFGKGFFATGAFSGNLGAGSSWLESTVAKRETDWSIRFGYHFRGYIGYNGSRFGFNVNYIYKNLNLNPIQGLEQSANTGNYRLNFIYKIRPGKKFFSTYSRFNPNRFL